MKTNIIFTTLGVSDPDAPAAGALSRGIPLVFAEKFDGANGFSARFHPFIAEVNGRRGWIVHSDELDAEKAGALSIDGFDRTHVVCGMLRTGDRMGLDMKVYSPDSTEPVYETSAEIPPGKMLHFLGTLALDMYTNLDGNVEVDIVKRFRNFGTTSEEAFTEYLTGRSSSLSMLLGFDIERPETAFTPYLNSLRADPAFVESLRHLATLSLSYIQSPELPNAPAIDALNEAVDTSADPQVALGALAVGLQMTEDYEGSIRAFEQAVNREPDGEMAPGLLEDFGALLAALGRHEQAVEKYRAAMDAGNTGLNVLEKLAASYASMSRTDEAREIWEKIVASDPDRPAAFANLARIAAIEGDKEKAVHYYECGRVARIPLWQLFDAYARFLLKNGLTAEALDVLEEFMERSDPAAVPEVARVAFGKLLLQAGRIDEARLEIEAVVNSAQDRSLRQMAMTHLFSIDHPGDLKKLAAAQQDAVSGDAEAAVKILRTLVKKHPELAAVRVTLAAALKNSGRFAEAAEAFEHALELDPADVSALVNLSELLEQAGDVPGAAAMMEKVSRIEPQNPAVYCRMAVLYMKQNKLNLAGACLRAAKEIAPDEPMIEELIAKFIELAEGDKEILK